MWFTIKGLGPSFDGLLVFGNDDKTDECFSVEKLVNREVMFGDRNVSLSLPKNSFWINKKYLLECKDPLLREFSSTNPWGKVILESRTTKGSLEVVWVEYEKCLQVTLLEKIGNTKTLYTENFMKNFSNLKQEIDRCICSDELEGLIFSLKEMKNDELFE